MDQPREKGNAPDGKCVAGANEERLRDIVVDILASAVFKLLIQGSTPPAEEPESRQSETFRA